VDIHRAFIITPCERFVSQVVFYITAELLPSAARRLVFSPVRFVATRHRDIFYRGIDNMQVFWVVSFLPIPIITFIASPTGLFASKFS